MKKYFMMCCTVTVVLLLCLAPSANYAQNITQTPAPAPAPDYVNLTYLLSVAGPYRTFLNYLETTKVIDTFQNQANNTEEGLTLFVPKDTAFSSLNNNKKNNKLSNLTQDQLKSLILFHALPHYYALSDFTNLSRQNPIPTFAGDGNRLYALNFTDESGAILIDSGWTKTKVTSAVHASDPVAIYQVDRVLLPEALFGTDIPPTPAPAPAPEIAPAADDAVRGGGGRGGRGNSSGDALSPTSEPSSSRRVSGLAALGHLAVGGGALLLWF